MRHARRGALVAVAAGAAGLGMLTGAWALWGTAATATLAPFPVGDVTFAAYPTDLPEQATQSVGGAPVPVVLPGSVIASVLDEDGPRTVFWRFTATGAATGITGLTYTVTAAAQVDEDDSTPLVDGVARPGTVLSGATTQVYPAAAGGDCSTVPPGPEEPADPAPDVVVHDSQDHLLQAAGVGDTGKSAAQVWCVAVTWDGPADVDYGNEVVARALAEDGSTATDRDRWDAVLTYPPTLGEAGEYHNRVQVTGLAEDGTTARDDDRWDALLTLDPSAEPDLLLELDPTVINLNPSVPPGDSFQPTP